MRKWLAILPHPFTLADRRAGFGYHPSILQAEFSLTQVLDSARAGRVFFEDVIRHNLDLGRPDRVGLIFNRQVRSRGKHPTPGRFRTRVITEGVTPSMRIDFKHSKIKQYHKLGAALRTETTINNSYDFRTCLLIFRLHTDGFTNATTHPPGRGPQPHRTQPRADELQPTPRLRQARRAVMPRGIDTKPDRPQQTYA